MSIVHTFRHTAISANSHQSDVWPFFDAMRRWLLRNILGIQNTSDNADGKQLRMCLLPLPRNIQLKYLDIMQPEEMNDRSTLRIDLYNFLLFHSSITTYKNGNEWTLAARYCGRLFLFFLDAYPISDGQYEPRSYNGKYHREMPYKMAEKKHICTNCSSPNNKFSNSKKLSEHLEEEHKINLDKNNINTISPGHFIKEIWRDFIAQSKFTERQVAADSQNQEMFHWIKCDEPSEADASLHNLKRFLIQLSTHKIAAADYRTPLFQITMLHL